MKTFQVLDLAEVTQHYICAGINNEQRNVSRDQDCSHPGAAQISSPKHTIKSIQCMFIASIKQRQVFRNECAVYFCRKFSKHISRDHAIVK